MSSVFHFIVYFIYLFEVAYYVHLMFCCRVDGYLLHDIFPLIIGFDLFVNM